MCSNGRRGYVGSAHLHRSTPEFYSAVEDFSERVRSVFREEFSSFLEVMWESAVGTDPANGRTVLYAIQIFKEVFFWCRFFVFEVQEGYSEPRTSSWTYPSLPNTQLFHLDLFLQCLYCHHLHTYVQQLSCPWVQDSRSNVGILVLLEGGWICVVYCVLHVDLPVHFCWCHLWAVSVCHALLCVSVEEKGGEEGVERGHDQEHCTPTSENGRTAEQDSEAKRGLETSNGNTFERS